MSFSKSIQVGNVGKLSLSEASGVATLSFTASESVGGVASFTQALGIELKASDLAKVLFDFIESKSPAGIKIFEEEAKDLAISLLDKA